MSENAFCVMDAPSACYRRHREFCRPPDPTPGFTLALSAALHDFDLPTILESQSFIEDSEQDELKASAEIQKVESFRQKAIEQLREVRKQWVEEIEKATREIESILVQKCEELLTKIEQKKARCEDRLNLDFDIAPVDVSTLIKQFVNISLGYTESRGEVQSLYKFFGGRNSACAFDSAAESVANTYHCYETFLHNSAWVVLPSGDVCITGGSLMGKSRTDALLFRPATEEIEALPPMATPRRSHSIVLFENIVYVFGGILQDQKIPLCESLKADGGTWAQLPNMHCARAFHGSTPFRQQLYTFGGCEVSGIDVYDPHLLCFTYLPLASVDITEACSAAANDDFIILFHGNYQGKVMQFFPESGEAVYLSEMGFGNSWSNCPPLRTANALFTLRADNIFKFDTATRTCTYVGRMASRKRRCDRQFS